jgi:hypothetical protein
MLPRADPAVAGLAAVPVVEASGAAAKLRLKLQMDKPIRDSRI